MLRGGYSNDDEDNSAESLDHCDENQSRQKRHTYDHSEADYGDFDQVYGAYVTENRYRRDGGLLGDHDDSDEQHYMYMCGRRECDEIMNSYMHKYTHIHVWIYIYMWM